MARTTADDEVTSRRTYDQACPVAGALDLVGERWTLLIVRDLMFGPLRFTELRAGLPGIAPNLLSARLRHLVAEGVIEDAEPGYRLTPRGRELGPVVHALARFGVADWGDADAVPPPARLIRGALLALMDPEVLGTATWSARLALGDDVVDLEVSAAAPGRPALGRLHLAMHDAADGAAADVEVRTSLGTLVELRQGVVPVDDALGAGRLVIDGGRRATDELGRLLGWWPDRRPRSPGRGSQAR
ncbi:MAG: helix-turn-helix transcriptional regulator [Acidimicrobiales bacterium]|nr:helix-turn-helix transcriptional regulator [Acidimicrobiales bacterium]